MGRPLSEVLTPVAERVTERVLDEEEVLRAHLVVALSGAHAYGFPSPDSDLDLKGVHVTPASVLLGLAPPANAANRVEVIEGVEVDYSSNELGQVLRGVLTGNGNYVERLLGPILPRQSSELATLAPLVRKSLSKRLHAHYRGFARAQLRAFEEGSPRKAKTILYVLRTTLTGAHALRTGEIVPDLTLLLDEHGFGEARQLVEAKRSGERVLLDDDSAERWRTEIGRAFEVLDAALEVSTLPDDAPNAEDLERFLLELRRARW